MRHSLIFTKGALMFAFLGMASVAHAFFFFFIPIPKGSANPDGMEATPAQRQYAMCAALNLNVIDPALGGKRETTWRGKVAASAQASVGEYKSFTELRNRYIRQWRLQSKNSYQAGMDYSRMLIAACKSANLPTTQDQYDLWQDSGKIVSDAVFPVVPAKPTQIISDARPLNRETWINQSAVPKIANPFRIKPTEVELQITDRGIVDYCDVTKSSGVALLDKQACEGVKANAKFIPKNEGNGPVSSVQTFSIDWPNIYAHNANDGITLPAEMVGDSTVNTPPIQQPTRVSKPTLEKDTLQSSSPPSGDPLMDKALYRCKVMGEVRGTPSFKACIQRQLDLLSK